MDDPVPIPGTVQQVDLDHTLRRKHNKDRKDIVLIPQPSSHPDDPLNWSRNRKLLNVFSQMAWCFIIACLISGLSSSYLLIAEDTGISVADLSTGNGIMYLFMGWGTLLTQNLAQDYGRRPVLLFSLLGCALLQVWSAHVQSVGEWYANRVLVGIFASAQEALIELCVADIHFTHDQGFHMGIYNWSLWCGGFLSPVAGAFVADSMGWKWIQYLLAIISVVFTVMTFFTFEETMFFRQVKIRDPISSSPKDTAVLESSRASDEKHAPETTETDIPDVTSVDATEVYETKTYTQKLKFWGGHHPSQPYNFVRSILLSFRLMLFPTVIFSGLLVGSMLAWYNVVGGSMAGILGNAPYNFSTQHIGLTYFGSVIGVSLGCYFSGWLSDIVAIKLARRRRGIKEPEDRLWLFLIPIVAHPVGCILYGVGATHHIHWIGVVIGMSLICLTLPMGSGLAITYIIDSQKELAGESIVTVILFRNTIGKLQCSSDPFISFNCADHTVLGFAFAYAVNPMITSMGLQNTFILLAVLGIVFWGGCLLWIKIGKSARRSTARTYWNLVEEHGLAAH
ncbi:hypothetical protein N7535_008268 [Penicillium sp. DV-2018c]|nr:hypothetical protein N7461_004307 [Penicillium sp. DV-2018c]KAJ5566630.1 hypothetical protein N7535_008268 [Penicillium sp. DV-2018c]